METITELAKQNVNLWTTTREQFVQDYLLVVENDQTVWNKHLEWAREADNTYALAVWIQDEWNEAIADLTSKIKPEVLGLLVSQMLLNQGIDPFIDIAKYVIEQLLKQGEL
jgi:hypothetical protein